MGASSKSYLYDKETCELVVVLNYEPTLFAENTNWYTEWRDGLIIEDHEFKHPKFDEETQHIVEKTRYELVVEGVEELNDGEYIDGESIISVEPDEDLIKPKWNKDTHVWEESATPEEIGEALFKAQVEFYNTELEFANKALTEYSCETITKEQFDEVKLYIQAIDPYAQPPVVATLAATDRAVEEEKDIVGEAIDRYNLFVEAKTKRPAIFERYDRQFNNNGVDINKVVPTV